MAMLIVLALIVAAMAATGFLRSREVTIIYAPMVGLLYRDGRFERELPPGRYAWFDPLRRRKVVSVSTAEQPTQLAEASVISKDQFSFRVGLAPVVKIVDPRLFNEAHPVVPQHAFSLLYALGPAHASLQVLAAAAALDYVAGKTLTEIFADESGISEAVKVSLEGAIPGVVVERVLLTAINLPPETRRMFTDVERARMEAQATLERARGEQASLRALANAARLMADNPALANLRLLQTIEAAKGATTIVVGNPASLSLGAAGEVVPAGSK